eukprot:11080810-Alexandrium_andersonii.AAC.1
MSPHRGQAEPRRDREALRREESCHTRAATTEAWPVRPLESGEGRLRAATADSLLLRRRRCR